ncbi:MAG TPA: alkaline phosphatase family protein [Candidatus Angelobacter sp.]|nr:alkaline phosphatase family protein [Candidatus Angelobacter sp.]
MKSWKHHRAARLISGVLALCLAFATPTAKAEAQTTFPQYDHVFLVIMENENFNQVFGSQFAPILNALAHDYGLATNYTGVADPSEPNYVAMLGGDFFGISDDDPYWFPGHTVNAANLMSQLEGAGKTWRGYFQSMPYAGYRGYCYPDKCNGIPDADTQYVTKHNGIVNFANLQTPAELGKMFPLPQLSADLAAGTVPNFSYIVPNECNDMHGAPPWCVDSGGTGSVQQNFLISQGDKFVGGVVNEITSSSMWQTGNNAIVITFDEGNTANSQIVTIVVTSHGPRGVTDKTSFNHFSLLASLQQTFSLGCLLNSCTASPMTNLFAITGTNTVPTLPPPFNFPTSSDTISAQGAGKQAAAASLGGSGWSIVPSYTFGSQDNVLAGVSAASISDAWAVGTYVPSAGSVLATLAEHFDGTRWTAFPLPNVGAQENCLMAVSMPSLGRAWAVGYFVNGKFQQQTLIEHFDGTVWSVVPSPSPGTLENILYGVAAISDSDVWAVGAQQDSSGLWHTLTEHWNGSVWSVVKAFDAGANGNQFYAVKALASNNVYAVGQQAGSGFPNQSLIERWNGSTWTVVSSPADAASALPLGVTATATSLTTVGEQETDTAPYTTYVTAGAPGSLSIQITPNAGAGENDLFAAATAVDGSTWAVGWDINTTSGNHDPLILQGINGVWSLVSSPAFAAGSDSGFAAMTAIPGGGLWAVGVTASSKSNYSTLIEFHP